MWIDPIVINWLFFGGAAFIGFMIGKLQGEGKRDIIVGDTITYLCEEGYIKHRYIDDGEEIEIFPHTEKK